MSPGRRPEVEMSGYDEERLAVLLRMLPPPPQGWEAAAQELPLVRPAIDSIVARAEADAVFRARLAADPEAAVKEAGYAATPSVLASLRVRLGG
jgi:hypothetical protein